MAMGKPESKKVKIVDDKVWSANIISEDLAAKTWHSKWGWLLKEYGDLSKKLSEVSKESTFLTKIKPKEAEDPRTIKPVPETINHQYGWIPSKEEFRLEKYGPDVHKTKPTLD